MKKDKQDKRKMRKENQLKAAKTKALEITEKLKRMSKDRDSSSEELQYIDRKNKNFKKWSPQEKFEHTLKYWKLLWCHLHAVITVNHQLALISTKVAYFGKQLTSNRIQKPKSCYEIIGIKLKNNILIMPDSRFKTGWNFLMIVLLLYVATLQIYIMAFMPEADSYSQVSGGSDIHNHQFYAEMSEKVNEFIDFLFFIDIAINFISAYERSVIDLTIETRFKLIAINYLAGFFIIDLVSALPLQTIYNLVNKSQESKNLLVVRTLKVLRIVKIVKLRKYNSTVIHFISQY